MSPPRSRADGEQPDLIVLGGDYVTWGDRSFVDPAGRGARAAVGAARRLRRSSATTTTITTCRRRWRQRRRGPQGRTHPADHPRRSARSGRHPLLDQARVRYRARRARRRRHGFCSRTIRGGWPKRPRSNSAGALAATPTADRSCCRGSAPSRRRSFRSSPASAAARRTTIFVSRGVGTVYVPVRINCPPEVAIVTLTRETQEI